MSRTILVWDNTTHTPASIPLEQYDEAIASGKYRAYEQTVVATDRLGATVDNTPDQARAALAGGEQTVDQTGAYAADVDARRAESFNNLGDRIGTFVENLADSATLGLVQDRSDGARARSAALPGMAFAGQLAGIATSLINPASAAGRAAAFLPLSKVTRGGEKLGAAVAKGIFKEAQVGEKVTTRIARRATDEAVQNAAVGAATAVGHGVTDSLIEDKPFAAEHLAASLGTDALVGGVVGGFASSVSHYAGKIKARDAIRKQYGILDPSSPQSASAHGAVTEAIGGWDAQLEHHRVQVGALKGMESVGELGAMGPDFLRGRAEALKAAERAAARLKKLDISVALASDSPKAVDRALDALDDYGAAMGRLDEVMRSRSGVPVSAPVDTADTLVTPQSGATTPGTGPVDLNDTIITGAPDAARARVTPGGRPMLRGDVGPTTAGLDDGDLSSLGVSLDNAMLKDPEALARYKELHGRDYEPYVERRVSDIADSPDATLTMRGGVETDTSELGSIPGTPKAKRRAQEATPGPMPDEIAELDEIVGRTTPGTKRARGEDAADTVPDGPAHLPDRRASPLEAFSYDVKAMAGRLGSEGSVSLRAVFDEMVAARGRVPGKVKHRGIGSFERFSELVGEAEIAGYLGTAGKRAPLANLGDIGDELVIDSAYVGGDMPAKPFNFQDRFGRFAPGKKGIWGHDTIHDAAAPVAESADPLGAALAGQGKGKAPRRDTVKDGVPAGFDPEAQTDTLVDMPRAEPAPGPADLGPEVPSRLDKVMADFEQSGPRRVPSDEAAAKVRAALEELQKVTGGRLGSVEAAEAALAAGLKDKARGQLGHQLAAIWGLRQLARAAAESAPGTSAKNGRLLKRLVDRSGAAAGRRFAMGNGGVVEGVKGAAAGVLGGHLIGAAFGMAGGLASSLGRARDVIVKSADALLRGKGSRLVASTPIAARYSYDGSEPTEDVAVRIEQLQAVAGNPDAVRQRALDAMGDFAQTNPDLAFMAAENHVRQIQNLAKRVPPITVTALGEARVVGQQDLRRFREYEDVTWNLGRALERVAAGCISQAQAEALREQHPETVTALAGHLLRDPGSLARCTREKMVQIERITGMTLSRRTPEFVGRQQMAFEPPPQAVPNDGASALRPPVGTPAQSMIAPGN